MPTMRIVPREESGYLPIAEIARGGMGTVWAALRREGSFERLYAMKRLRDSYREDSSVRDMFMAEGRIAGLIRHPNVVSVLDVGEDDSGPFLVMDYVDGVTVSTLIRRLRSIDQRLPVPLAMQIVADAARGLSAAHAARTHEGEPVPVVHRDVSPQNLLLGFDGIVRVTDFGVAKVLGHLAQTADGVLKGKLGYMAPEQLRFEELDHRCDLFGLGVVLFELLSGERLYGGDGARAARRILKEAPPDIGEIRGDLPPELVGLLLSLLAKEPSQRPPSATDVAERLDRIRTSFSSEAELPPLAEYLAALFEAERDAERERLATAVRTASRITVSPDADEPPTARERRRPRLLWPAIALLLGLALPLIGYAVLGTGPVSDERATDRPPEAAQRSGLPAPAPPTVEPASEPEDATGEAAETAEGEADEASTGREASASEPRAAPVRRARTRSRPRAAEPSRADEPTAMEDVPRALPRDDIWSMFE